MDMYANKHTGRHMKGASIKILLLTLPSLLRDLIVPGVWRNKEACIIVLMYQSYMIFEIVYEIVCDTVGKIYEQQDCLRFRWKPADQAVSN